MSDFDYNIFLRPISLEEMMFPKEKKTDKAAFIAQYPPHQGKGWRD